MLPAEFVNGDNLISAVESALPETAAILRDLQIQYAADGYELVTHTVISQGIVGPLLLPAMARRDHQNVSRIFSFLLSLLNSRDENVREAVVHRALEPWRVEDFKRLRELLDPETSAALESALRDHQASG